MKQQGLSSRFIKVRCKCKNEQVIFNKAASDVKCVVCGEKLATPSGGKASVLAKVVETLN